MRLASVAKEEKGKIPKKLWTLFIHRETEKVRSLQRIQNRKQNL